MPGTKHVSKVWNVTAMLWLWSMVHLFVFLSLRSMCAVPRTAVFCNVFVIIVVIIIIVVVVVVVMIIIIIIIINTALIFSVVSSPTSSFYFGKVCCPFSYKILYKVAVSYWTIPQAVRSEAWVCGQSLAGIAGSNPAGCTDVCLVRVLCVVMYRSLHRADHSSVGVLTSVQGRSVIEEPHRGGLRRLSKLWD